MLLKSFETAWSVGLLTIGIVLTSTVVSISQTINRAEYFFDTDPGVGNGIALAVTPGSAINQS